MSNPFDIIEPYDSPNDGRDKINYNFSLIGGGITATTSGSTYVTGGTNINVVSGTTGLANFVFGVALNSGITLSSVSGTSISADTFYSGSTNLGTIISSVSTAVTYTNSAATPSTLGGIAAGSTFSNQTIKQMFDSLLYPYQTPSFSSFARTSLLSTYEWGQTTAIGSQTFTWATSNSSNVSANTISIIQNFSPVTTLVNHGTNGGSTAITLANSYSASSVSTTTLYTISATNTQNASLSRTISATWLPRWYYGKFSGTSINSSQLVALPSNALVSSVTNAYYVIPTGVTSDYVFFAIPNSFGQPSDFRDSTSGCFGTNFPFSVQGSVSVTNSYGVNITYTVYRLTNATAGSLNVWLCP